MTGRKQRYTAEEVVEAIRATRGRVHSVARRLGCDARTIYNYAERYASVRDELDMQRGLRGDTAEFKLDEAIDRGEAWAVKYYLSTQCKDRGYVERQEITGQDGVPFKVKMTWGDGEDA